MIHLAGVCRASRLREHGWGMLLRLPLSHLMPPKHLDSVRSTL